jgi:hypothetical protein
LVEASDDDEEKNLREWAERLKCLVSEDGWPTDQTTNVFRVYGTNIGVVVCHVFEPDTYEVKNFISDYSVALDRNLWDRAEATCNSLQA